jgi:hypothetical protein
MGIEPDLKDWTWVLERVCPECGYDAASVDPVSVGSRLRAQRALWRAELERSHAADRPSPDRWSTVEYACHVRDVGELFEARLRLMLAEDDPLFANWDQDATAVERRYAEQSAEEVAPELDDALTSLAESFDAVAPEEWSRTGRRSDGASFTVASFARYLLHDVEHHAWDIERGAGAVDGS